MALYITILAYYAYDHKTCKAILLYAKDYIINHPAEAALIAVAVGAPLKYVQRKLRFSRINAIKWKFGFTDNPSTWEDMTIEQAQEIEQNMAEVRRPSGVRALNHGNPLLPKYQIFSLMAGILGFMETSANFRF